MFDPDRDYILCIRGDTFSPQAAAARLGVPIESWQEPGAPKRRGPDRGKPSPYGSGALARSALEGPAREDLRAFLALVQQLLPELRAMGADSMTLDHVVNYEGQCNMEWNTEELQALAQLGLTFCLSCYRQDPDPAPYLPPPT